MIRNAGMHVLSVPVEDMEKVTVSARDFGLDFDDAYQYVAAETHELTIVSFDSDFNRTKKGRKTPREIFPMRSLHMTKANLSPSLKVVVWTGSSK